MKRTRDGRHASVVFDGTAAAPVRRAGFPIRYRTTPIPLYANTGMDLILARGARLPFAFYDVADPDAMLAALDQARTRLG